VRPSESLDVGICCSGPFAGSWISGPRESVIEASGGEVDDEIYSWSWSFQPFQAEFDLPAALTRREALDQLREWKVNWASPSIAGLARAVLFDDTGFEERRSFLGLIRSVELRPIEGVNFLVSRSSIKLQSVRAVVTLKQQLEKSFPQLSRIKGPLWSSFAGEIMKGEFIEIDRRGFFASMVDLPKESYDGTHRELTSKAAFRGDIVARARQLAGSRECLAFVPHGASLANDLLPVAPWAWLWELRNGGTGPAIQRPS